MWNERTSTNAETCNRDGCPYLNQTGYDAVLDWANVLASIDCVSLPQSLQLELLQLQLQAELINLPRAECSGQ